jgi:predicted nucleotidyltransferase
VAIESPSGRSDRTRVDVLPIRDLIARIVASWQPEQIWLFGSRARGTATPESDWDLLVVVPDGIDEAMVDPLSAWRLRRESGVSADVVPCRARDFREDCSTPNTLAFEAAKRGLLLYER